MARLFAEVVAPSGRVCAIDRDRQFIESLVKETLSPLITPMVADITGRTNFNAAATDLIYISTVIHVFTTQQMQGFIREVKRILKSDALLAIVEMEKKGNSLRTSHASATLPERVAAAHSDDSGRYPDGRGTSVNIQKYGVISACRPL